MLVGLELSGRRAASTSGEGRVQPIPASARAARATAKTVSVEVELEDPTQSAEEEFAREVPRQPSAMRIDARESLAELRELAAGAGAEVTAEFLQQRARPDPATLIGRGKIEEIAAAAASADVVIFDHDLTPSQQRNIEREVGRRVIDRTQLILDIFARHARTREGQLQVELAQLEYLLPRLGGRGIEMSQLGGGIGTRGPGETQLETDRRKIHRRIRHIKEQLEDVRRTRAQQRSRRASVPISTVALVGYTNAGKSTLFNALTNAGVLSSSRMFATLDPTIRSVALPSKRQVLLSDTVGFIRNLPHTLVTAFRATLEEVQKATLILEVSDATSPVRREQETQVEAVLHELEADRKPRLRVLNKVDALPASERELLRDTAGVVHVSALKGIGLDALREQIDVLLEEDPLSRVQFRIPQSAGKALALVEAGARIYSRQYRGGQVVIEAQAPESLLRSLSKEGSATWRVMKEQVKPPSP
ncbi:MAG: GTPase HflX [Candidatus Korobacteraceae bacterium]